ncbi:hypothetical protein [Actinomadura sp. BRA 177]|uniref:hypothetical protein n=1 Tax=Actinomadura sp. BRA 177 TaxID=2745202 RepID=UPI0020CDD831|nr:hypothetical protein [Actinomadura sp. BRA 177]
MGNQGDGRIGIVLALVRGTFLVNAVYAESVRKYGITSQQRQLLGMLMARPRGINELAGCWTWPS